MIEVHGLRIDDEALFGIAHNCNPTRFGTRCVCCETYEVCVSEDEIPLIEGCIAAAIARGLVPPDTANAVDETDDGEYALDTDEEGLCLLAVRQPNGASHCGLHTAALQAAIEPYANKPRACALWPLALSEEDRPVLGITQDAFDFPCNTPRDGAPNSLDKGIAAIIDALYGPAVRRHIEAVQSSRR